MSESEEKEYRELADKREKCTLTGKEYQRWRQLVSLSFREGLPKVFHEWKDGFKLN